MAKVKKTETKKETDTPKKEVVETPPVLQETATATTTTKTTKKSAPKKEKVVEPTVTSATTNATTEVSVSEVTETNQITSSLSEVTTVDGFTDFIVKLQGIISGLNSLKADFRQLEKRAIKELKVAQKFQNKRKRKTSNRSPSGFVKPTLISTELANFLNKPEGSEMARTEVTREINSYIRAHNLQDKDNGRKINPDTQLAELLKIKNGEELTYFNLQRYMSPHFAKMSKESPISKD